MLNIHDVEEKPYCSYIDQRTGNTMEFRFCKCDDLDAHESKEISPDGEVVCITYNIKVYEKEVEDFDDNLPF